MNTHINLLPDIKQNRLKQKRVRELAVTISMVVLAVSIGIPIILLAVKGSQKLYLNRVQSQINSREQTLTGTTNINTILSAKDHLNSLPALYDKRVFLTELLAYLPSVTPTAVKLSSVSIDTAGQITFGGSTTTYNLVDTFYHSLQNAGVSVDPNKVEPNPDTNGYFTSVVLASESGQAGKEIDFSITADFSPKLTNGVPND